MFSDLQIEALSQGCAQCSKSFLTNHIVKTAYYTGSVRDFGNQVELGIIGASVRNIWVHFNCDDPTLEKGGVMIPDIHLCLHCKKRLGRNEIISPAFRIDDPQATNPYDPTDKGVALGDRVYFVHVNCKNPTLTGESHNILIAP